MSYFWTNREIATLKRVYPVGGIAAAEAELKRTRYSIYQHARVLGLNAPNQPAIRQHYAPDARIDEEIIALHATAVLRGAVASYAARIGRPTWWVSKRARELGLKTPRFKELPWSQTEVDILLDNAGEDVHLICRRLASRGFHRTVAGIAVKLKREHVQRRTERMAAGIYTASEIAGIFGADAKAPLNWITRYGLRASRTPSGGETRVDERDLRAWIVAHPERVNLRRMPDAWQPWFIELLARRDLKCETSNTETT